MKWPAFIHDGMAYDLSHLHPRTYKFTRAAENNKPAEVYKVDTIFTSHCFTRKPKPNEIYDPKWIYPHDDEKRLFDLQRYTMSKKLPEIIRDLPVAARKPISLSDNRGKFFTVEIIAEDGTTIEYDIFFKITKASKGRLVMILETAFVRDSDHDSIRPAGKPVRFWIILHNTLHNRKIRL